IIDLSENISGNRDDPNPSDIISYSQNEDLILMGVSSLLFVLVLAFFTKVVFIDHKEEFGIESWKSTRAFWFFLLTISFISLVFILLDIALINVYLITGPVLFIWSLNSEFHLNFSYVDQIPIGTDRLAYADIRGTIFMALYAFILLFPLGMFVVILSRAGRRELVSMRVRPKDPYTLKKFIKFFLVIPFEGLLISGFAGLSNSEAPPAVSLALLIVIILIAAWWLGQLLLLIFRAIKYTAFITYSNVLIVVPIIFLFYILPGLIWGAWDLLYIWSNNGDLENTIYNSEIVNPQNMRIVPYPDQNPDFDVTTLGWQDLLIFYLQTVFYNLGSFIRIVELDFIIIVGISALVIGFAEGYSIVAIFRSIATGVSVARSGRIARRSAPRMIVITSRLVYLLAWLALLWDKFLVLWNTIVEELAFDFPLIDVPRIFLPIYDLSLEIEDLGGIFIPLAILFVPFYFIVTSSFKFLSVSLVADKTKHDMQVFFLLISSAFILIISQILADITDLPEFQDDGDHKEFLPLAGRTTENVLHFASKLFEFTESAGFYAGVIFSLGLLFKVIINKIRGVSDEDLDIDLI
ncbi:MAG: hypothetical protein ACW98K_13850, partial [Candidatus Kariarchaeaceae archaeon]